MVQAGGSYQPDNQMKFRKGKKLYSLVNVTVKRGREGLG